MRNYTNLEEIKRNGKIKNLWELVRILKKLFPDLFLYYNCEDYGCEDYNCEENELVLPVCFLINKMFGFPVSYCSDDKLTTECLVNYQNVYDEKFYFTIPILVEQEELWWEGTTTMCGEELTKNITVLSKEELEAHIKNSASFKGKYSELVNRINAYVEKFEFNKYDEDGFDMFGYNKDGYDKGGLDKYGRGVDGKAIYDKIYESEEKERAQRQEDKFNQISDFLFGGCREYELEENYETYVEDKYEGSYTRKINQGYDIETDDLESDYYEDDFHDNFDELL